MNLKHFLIKNGEYPSIVGGFGGGFGGGYGSGGYGSGGYGSGGYGSGGYGGMFRYYFYLLIEKSDEKSSGNACMPDLFVRNAD